jgi:hypothetical protein
LKFVWSSRWLNEAEVRLTFIALRRQKKPRKKISSTLEKYLTSKSRVSLNQKTVLVFSPSRLILCNKRNVFISENYNFESQKAKKKLMHLNQIWQTA